MTVPGDVLAGRYRLVRLVATGGMGSVWEAWDQLLQRRVALKDLLTPAGLTAEDAAMARSRVIREARITARLHHPHAVTLYDVLDHGGLPCLILQYVPSQTLNSILAERGVVQVPFVIGVAAEIASALAAAHHVGIVHRDVKPSNVLITPAGAAMITDFGISNAVGDVSLTSTGMVSGTPAFLAPEVARGAASGFPADVFSLGATLYAALEGSPPFGADQNAMAILHKVASGQIIPPRRSGVLTAVLSHMMSADPAARPAMSDVARLLADLRDPRAAVPAPQLHTVALPPRTVQEWPAEHDEWSAERDEGTAAAAPPARGVASAAPAPAGRGRRHRRLILVTAAALMLAAIGTWLAVGGTRPQPAVSSSTTVTSPAPSTAAVRVLGVAGTTAPSPSAAPLTSGAPSTRRTTGQPVPAAVPARTPTTAQSTAAAPRRTNDAVAAPSKIAGANARTSAASSLATSTSHAVPTPAELAAAITGYYALLPGNTDQAWASLTPRFRSGTAKNRQYYQRFWDSVQQVTATDAHGASPDTAEATVTYQFKDGRTATEITVYSLVQQGGTLEIDSSTVLSSTIR